MACETAKGSDTQNSKIGLLDHPLAHLYILIFDEISECQVPFNEPRMCQNLNLEI